MNEETEILQSSYVYSLGTVVTILDEWTPGWRSPENFETVAFVTFASVCGDDIQITGVE